jgi:N-acetylmuramoyl-L-alanine amidase
VTACFAGRLVWQTMSGPEDSGPPTAVPGPGGSAAAQDPKAPRTGDDGSQASRGPSSASAGLPAPPQDPPEGPLAGRTVVIDPGHNPGNRDHTAEIDKLVGIGTGRKECDTTGTATNSGYAEAEFTLDVSRRIRTILRQQGATVVFTQDGNRAWGPCIDERARIGNKAEADAVVSVHADGSAAGNRGFHVILPARVASGAADTSAIVGPSRELGERIAGRFLRATGSAPSNYAGGGTGLVVRDDLGGLNLSAVPKAFVECGNMRDPQDAALLTNAKWRQKAARGIAEGIAGYLGG